MIHFFNTQTLALMAVVAGFVVLCLGLWYVWTNQSQLRTEIQLLRSQQPMSNAATIVPTANRAPVPSEDATDILAAMVGTHTTVPPLESAHDTGVKLSDPANTPHEVVHRSQETHVEDQSGSESSDSEYDDDDEDVTDEEEESHAVEKEEQSADLVESLLSSMVTNAIDNSVEMQGGPSAIMNSVETPDIAELQSSTVCDTVDETKNDSVLQETNDDHDVVQENDGGEEECEEEEFKDEPSLTEQLREHTVPQLKVMCQQHDIGIRHSSGKNKRKDELIADLVQAMSQTNLDEGHETASNESVSAAGV